MSRVLHELRSDTTRVQVRKREGGGWLIVSSTGYRAELPNECPADSLCFEQRRIPCLKPWGHHGDTAKHSSTHCHGFGHIEQAVALAEAVLRTYGSADKGKTQYRVQFAMPDGPSGKRVTRMSVSEWAPFAERYERPAGQASA